MFREMQGFLEVPQTARRRNISDAIEPFSAIRGFRTGPYTSTNCEDHN